jgi:hypothetical protein
MPEGVRASILAGLEPFVDFSAISDPDTNVRVSKHGATKNVTPTA